MSRIIVGRYRGTARAGTYSWAVRLLLAPDGTFRLQRGSVAALTVPETSGPWSVTNENRVLELGREGPLLITAYGSGNLVLDSLGGTVTNYVLRRE